MHILVVEAEVEAYLHIRQWLDEQFSDADMDWAPNYEQALKLINTQHYDVCLIGYHANQPQQQAFLTELSALPSILLTQGNEQVEALVGLERFVVLSLQQLEPRLLNQMIAHLAAQITLRQTLEHFKLSFNNSFDFIAWLDIEDRVIEMNQTALSFFGLKRHQVIGVPLWETPWAHSKQHAQLKAACRQHQFVHEEIEVIGAQGQHLTLDFSITPFNNDTHEYQGALVEGRDLSRRQRLEQQWVAGHWSDQLTGLPNRQFFLEQLERTMHHHNDHQVAVLLIDLDRFKVINASLGHDMGDWLLMELAQRLLSCVPAESSVLAHSGGDEFMILLTEMRDLSEATTLASTIHERLTRPFSLEGYEIVTSASIGIAYSRGSVDRAHLDLLRDADAALYHAKAMGKSCYAVFNQGMHAQAVSRLQWEMDLHKAVERQNFVLFYQPQLALASEELTGVEALIRLHHPKKGFLSPIDFLSILEDTGIIIPVGEWSLRTACHQLKIWRDNQLHLDHIAVNLSAHQLRRKQFPRIVADCIDAYALSPESLELELTESMLLEDIQSAVKTLTLFKDMGIRVTIDDFGTGYASLSYLKRFPVDALKIDGSFIQGLTVTPEDAAITVATIDMAHALGLQVIAEGVETIEQHEFLRDHGCDYAQGYLYALPMEQHPFLKWAQQYNIVMKKSTRWRYSSS